MISAIMEARQVWMLKGSDDGYRDWRNYHMVELKKKRRIICCTMILAMISMKLKWMRKYIKTI